MVKVKGHDDGWESNVCSFRFANLRRDQNLTLVVSLNDGGRGGCGQVTIVDRTPAGFKARDGAFATMYGIDNVSDVIKDVNHDGKLFLVFDHQFTVGSPALAPGVFSSYPVIYGWDGKNYTDVSRQPQFKHFYQDQIASMTKPSRHSMDAASKASVSQIHRIIDQDPNAGLGEAVKWATSKDPEDREFAAQVLGQIATPEAKKYLSVLAKDTVKLIAETAQRELQSEPGGDLEASLESIGSADRLNAPWWLLSSSSEVDEAHQNPMGPDDVWQALGGYASKELCEQEIAKDSRNPSPNTEKCIPAPPL